MLIIQGAWFDVYINIAYLGYECCEEKIRRGADKIFKYLYVPEL